MGDTKRGRERKGMGKRQQRREREIYRALREDDGPSEPFVPEDTELSIGSD
ncbi:hypothetical protein [Halarchaeum nitratireducens]|uniref:Uncharacterized protein n=1 Tax=Halarchaeum nitratireducens TaxID=489913 RepID=A0A830GC06_9EURY|nr:MULTISPECIES: hypothetical protein [Halarchaeum]MBP2251539.1 hypothetical protein [Halarchaeum solikamskense]GGN14183.1 hypothetical protein GCM10009021_12990 [Halarchaeum nitratireducens]